MVLLPAIAGLWARLSGSNLFETLFGAAIRFTRYAECASVVSPIDRLCTSFVLLIVFVLWRRRGALLVLLVALFCLNTLWSHHRGYRDATIISPSYTTSCVWPFYGRDPSMFVRRNVPPLMAAALFYSIQKILRRGKESPTSQLRTNSKRDPRYALPSSYIHHTIPYSILRL